MKYALDTNIVSLYIRGNPGVTQSFDAAVENGDEIVVPALVHYEIRRGLLCKSHPRFEKFYEILIEQCPVAELSNSAIERGAEIYAGLYRAKRTVEDADLLIAAFCMDGEYTLITNNTRHFEVIDGLKYEDWSALHGV